MPEITAYQKELDKLSSSCKALPFLSMKNEELRRTFLIKFIEKLIPYIQSTCPPRLEELCQYLSLIDSVIQIFLQYTDTKEKEAAILTIEQCIFLLLKTCLLLKQENLKSYVETPQYQFISNKNSINELTKKSMQLSFVVDCLKNNTQEKEAPRVLGEFTAIETYQAYKKALHFIKLTELVAKSEKDIFIEPFLSALLPLAESAYFNEKNYALAIERYEELLSYMESYPEIVRIKYVNILILAYCYHITNKQKELFEAEGIASLKKKEEIEDLYDTVIDLADFYALKTQKVACEFSREKFIEGFNERTNKEISLSSENKNTEVDCFSTQESEQPIKNDLHHSLSLLVIQQNFNFTPLEDYDSPIEIHTLSTTSSLFKPTPIHSAANSHSNSALTTPVPNMQLKNPFEEESLSVTQNSHHATPCIDKLLFSTYYKQEGLY